MPTTMSNGVVVAARALETTFVNADAGEQATAPYLRVVAIEMSAGLEVCAGTEATVDTATRLDLRFANVEQAERFIRFFTQVITKHDPIKPGNRNEGTGLYSCHDFGYEMTASSATLARRMNVWRWYAEDMNLQPASPPFAIGQFACLGTYSDAMGQYVIRHSVVGQGENTDMCLSVLDDGGPLAYASYDALQHRYSDAFGAAQYLADASEPGNAKTV